MADEDITTRAEALRLEGNELFKVSKFPDAIVKYGQAHKLVPQQAAPLANLAAAYFEIGEYKTSNDYAAQALKRNPTDESRFRLYGRQVRALMFLKEYDAARETLTKCAKPLQGELAEADRLLSLISKAAALNNHEQDLSRNLSVLRQPVIQATIGKHQDKAVVGNDAPASLFDTSLLGRENETVSFLFAELGDARNLFQTLIHIASPAIKVPVNTNFEFTCTDRSAASIARDLLLLLLLTDAGDLSDETRREQAIAAAFYIYLSAVMPQELYSVVQSYIYTAVRMLDGRQPLPIHLDIAQRYRGEVLRVLRFWQIATSSLQTGSVRDAVVKVRATSTQDLQFIPGSLARLSQESVFYRKTGILLADPIKSSKSLMDTIVSLDAEQDVPSPVLSGIDRHWRPNLTLFGPDSPVENQAWPQLDIAPFELGSQVTRNEPSPDHGLFTLVGRWLRQIAVSLNTLKDRVTIDLAIGDPTPFLLARSQKYCEISTTSRRQPPKYDRIHLADFTDHASGIMFVYLFAGPALQANAESYITWKTVSEAKAYKTWQSYDSACLDFALSNGKAQSIFDSMFGLAIDKKIYNDDGASNLFMHQSLNGYRRARKIRTKQSFDDLLSVSTLHKWLRQVLQRTTLFEARQTKSGASFSLNLNAFLTLLRQLSLSGYPAHWLNEVVGLTFVSDLSSTSITSILEQSYDFPLPVKPLCLRSADASNIALTWHNYLPFGVISGKADYHMSTRFHVCIPGKIDAPESAARLILVFSPWTLKSKDRAGPPNAAEWDKVKPSMDEQIEIYLMSIFTFDQQHQTLEFELNGMLYEKMQDDHYKLALMDVKNRKIVSSHVPTHDFVNVDYTL